MFEIRPLVQQVDLVKMTNLLEASGYGNINPADLQGTQTYGMFMEDESMFACAMVIRQGRQAYIDYVAVHGLMRGEGYGSELTHYLRNLLIADGVTIVHACIEGTNGASLRMTSKHRPRIGFPFTKLTIDLKEGGDSHG